jgi:hypothetical protein
MRVLTAAVLISAALHGGAIAWVQTRPEKDTAAQPAVTQPAVEIVPVPAAEPPPMVVALLDDHTVVRTSPPVTRENSSSASKDIGAGRVRTETAAAAMATATVHEPPPRTEPPRRNPLLTMRRPTLDTQPSQEFTAQFLKNSRPLAPKDIRTEQLADELARTEGQLANPRWIANASPDQVTAARMSAVSMHDELTNRELQPDGTGTKSEHRAFGMKFAADGTVDIRDNPNVKREGLLSGSFDVTDALMRRQGIDPYSSYKLKVLDETREERVAIGKRYRTQQLALSKQLVQKNLDRLWTSTSDPAARKQGLFELWDDCAETGPEDVVVAGASARAHVVGFVRSKLPQGTADAFTADELARFNKQRKSLQPFAPY